MKDKEKERYTEKKKVKLQRDDTKERLREL